MDGDEAEGADRRPAPALVRTRLAPHEQEWREAAERDAEAKRALAKRHTPEQLVELATRGYQYTPPAAIRTIAFFPSWSMRPWVILWEHKSTKIFCYPIAPAAEEGASPAEVARVYKALGDEGRLKLLRRLSDGPMKLSEAAAELGVAKSTAHHHLAILRQAGLRDDPRRGRERLQPAPRPAADGRPAHRLPGRLQVLGDERVEHAVDPAVAAAVRLPLDALADEAERPAWRCARSRSRPRARSGGSRARGSGAAGRAEPPRPRAGGRGSRVDREACRRGRSRCGGSSAPRPSPRPRAVELDDHHAAASGAPPTFAATPSRS